MKTWEIEYKKGTKKIVHTPDHIKSPYKVGSIDRFVCPSDNCEDCVLDWSFEECYRNSISNIKLIDEWSLLGAIAVTILLTSIFYLAIFYFLGR